MTNRKCGIGVCKNKARFMVYQAVEPQILLRYEDGTIDMETEPAGRSNHSCGNHLNYFVTTLGSLPYRKYEPVRVTLVNTK